MAATTIAAAPPNKRNERKTAQSEKLIAKRDLGSCRLIRGATRPAKIATAANRKLSVEYGRESIAARRNAAPSTIVTVFTVLERLSLLIPVGYSRGRNKRKAGVR